MPHLFLEGMLIASWAVEAEACFVYIRDEYPAVIEILRREIAALEAAGIVPPAKSTSGAARAPTSAARSPR